MTETTGRPVPVFPTDLADRLTAIGLCTEQDLRRCRHRVRRMTRDLPAFDSIWIDALVQRKRITPFQARLIETGEESLLRVGPYLLTNKRWSDGQIELFQAQESSTSCSCDVAVLHADGVNKTEWHDALKHAATRQRSVHSPHIAIIQAINLDDERLVAVSQAAKGHTLQELLIRRGRFPVEVVVEIARQLVAGLAELEKRDLLHGDIRARLVTLSRRGNIQLHWPGVTASACPHLTYHANLPPDCYDGIAPELIDTRRTRTTASDIYALGCLLWELCTGRPPFPGGDALTKLTAAQSLAVVDVRDFAPEVPELFAKALSRMTAHEFEQRPSSFTDIQKRFGPTSHRGRHRLARFARQYESSAPAAHYDLPRKKSPGRKIALTATAALALFAISLSHSKSRSELLRIATNVRDEWLTQQTPTTQTAPSGASSEDAPKASATPNPPQTAQALPAQADAVNLNGRLTTFPSRMSNGVVSLTSIGPYDVTELEHDSPLTIRGTGPSPAVIVVSDRPLSLLAPTVILENVRLVRRNGDGTAHSDLPLLNVSARDLGMKSCRIDAGAETTEHPAAVIDWYVPSEHLLGRGRLAIQSCAINSAQCAIRCQSWPLTIRITDIDKHGSGNLIDLSGAGVRTESTDFELNHSRFRDSGSLLATPSASHADAAPLRMQIRHSAIRLLPDRGLISITGAFSLSEARQALAATTVTGINSQLQTGTPFATARQPNGIHRAVSDSPLLAEGFQFTNLLFNDEAAVDPSDSQAYNSSPTAH